MTTQRVKIVYAQSRKPGVDRLRFLALWREHGGMAMALQDYFGDVQRYVQGDVVETAGTLSGEPRSYDGVGEIAFPDLASLQAANASSSRTEIVLPHGRELFGSPNPISLVGTERVVWAPRYGSVKQYVFVRRHPDYTRQDFERAWDEATAAWKADSAKRDAIVSYARFMPIAPDAEFDAVEETTFDSIAHARRVHDEPAALVRALDACGQTVRILTHQVVLLDTDLFR